MRSTTANWRWIDGPQRPLIARPGLADPDGDPVLACSVQTFHLVQHSRYCKSDAEWTSIYEQKAEDALDEDDS